MNAYYGCGNLGCAFGPPPGQMPTLGHCECVKTISNGVRCAKTKAGIEDLRTDLEAIKIVMSRWAAAFGMLGAIAPDVPFNPEEPEQWAAGVVGQAHAEAAYLRGNIWELWATIVEQEPTIENMATRHAVDSFLRAHNGGLPLEVFRSIEEADEMRRSADLSLMIQGVDAIDGEVVDESLDEEEPK